MNRFPYPSSININSYHSILTYLKTSNSLKISGWDISSLIMIIVSGLAGFFVLIFIIFLIFRKKKPNNEVIIDIEAKIDEMNQIDNKNNLNNKNRNDDNSQLSNQIINQTKNLVDTVIKNKSESESENKSKISYEINSETNKKIEENFSAMQEIMAQKFFEINSLAKDKEKKITNTPINEKIEEFYQTEYSKDKEIENQNISKIIEEHKDIESVESSRDKSDMFSMSEKYENNSISKKKSLRKQKVNDNGETIIIDNEKMVKEDRDKRTRHNNNIEKNDFTNKKHEYDKSDKIEFMSKIKNEVKINLNNEQDQKPNYFNKNNLSKSSKKNEEEADDVSYQRVINENLNKNNNVNKYNKKELNSYTNEWYEKHNYKN